MKHESIKGRRIILNLDDRQDVADDPGTELVALSQHLQADNSNLTFTGAVHQAMAVNPRLHLDYLDSNGVLGVTTSIQQED